MVSSGYRNIKVVISLVIAGLLVFALLEFSYGREPYHQPTDINLIESTVKKQLPDIIMNSPIVRQHLLSIMQNPETIKQPLPDTKPSLPVAQNQSPSSDCNCGPLPTDEVLATLPHSAVAQIYHNYVNTIQIFCRTSMRMGHMGDGGWDVCLDPPYTLQRPCLVYSFGISGDWSFDDAITSQFGCDLHAYDPTIKLKDHDRKPNLHFHLTGLGDKDEVNSKGWKMRTFNTLLQENGHPEATVDVLKIDIEHSEWQAFPQMLESGAFKRVKQFCFEFHVKLKEQPEASAEKYIKGLQIFRKLYHAGYRIYKTNKNMDAKYTSKFGPLRTGCHEIYMIKSNTKTFA